MCSLGSKMERFKRAREASCAAAWWTVCGVGPTGPSTLPNTSPQKRWSSAAISAGAASVPESDEREVMGGGGGVFWHPAKELLRRAVAQGPCTKVCISGLREARLRPKLNQSLHAAASRRRARHNTAGESAALPVCSFSVFNREGSNVTLEAEPARG